MKTKTFPKYLKEQGLRPYNFSQAHKLATVTVWRAANRMPVSPKPAMEIHLATGKRVPLLTLIYPDQYPDLGERRR
jgi:hypothetical protein